MIDDLAKALATLWYVEGSLQRTILEPSVHSMTDAYEHCRAVLFHIERAMKDYEPSELVDLARERCAARFDSSDVEQPLMPPGSPGWWWRKCPSGRWRIVEVRDVGGLLRMEGQMDWTVEIPQDDRWGPQAIPPREAR